MSIAADFLVIGSGLAGLTFALDAAKHGSVILLTKKSRSDANSSWAQGGIAGVLSDEDSFELHKQDTLVAGAGLCNEEAVEILVREGPERIRDLITLGASFDTTTDTAGRETLSLGREGGHSRNRIVHTADYTGWECERTLLEAASRCENLTILEHYFVTDLVISQGASGRRCVGAYALDTETGRVETFTARAVLLATGGAGHVYQYTTNPVVATGDGVAMAWAAGVSVANMEFVQFHPTTLYHPAARAFLITEAMRGEGGILRHVDGEAFMERYHPLKELAPRDIVARAIVSELKRRDVPCVYLDVTHLNPEHLRSHFPTVYERCLSVGIDITREPIPIVPAQHYQCGGVLTDMDGATELPGLYAAGEVACTGVHGANRLASNSLLEAMVFGRRAAIHALDHAPGSVSSVSLFPDRSRLEDGSFSGRGGRSAVQELRAHGQRRMQRYVGIVRTTAELETVDRDMREAIHQLRTVAASSADAVEAMNLLVTGSLIVRSALRRRESRGLHYIVDYPTPVDAERHDTLLRRDDANESEAS